jgi:hypothetical protein
MTGLIEMGFSSYRYIFGLIGILVPLIEMGFGHIDIYLVLSEFWFLLSKWYLVISIYIWSYRNGIWYIRNCDCSYRIYILVFYQTLRFHAFSAI